MRKKTAEAIDQAYQKNFFRKNACGSGWDFDIYIHYGREHTYAGKKPHYWKA